MNISIMIICGGNSSRMGSPKYALPWGTQPLLEHLIIECKRNNFDDILVVSSPTVRDGVGCLGKNILTVEEIVKKHPSVRLIYDQYEGIGPLGALEVGLREVCHNYVLVIATDMPSIDVCELLQVYQSAGVIVDHSIRVDGESVNVDAYVPLIKDQMMPFGAIYHTTIYNRVKEAIEKQQYGVKQMLRKSTAVTIPMDTYERYFQNINYPLEYKCALWKSINHKETVKIVSVSAVKSKSGKTTIAEGLTRYFTDQGKSVGFVKSTHHLVDREVEGSDTWKVSHAGAKDVVIVRSSKEKELSNQLVEKAYSLDVDIAIIESRTKAVGPMVIAIHRDWTIEELRRWMLDSRVVALVCAADEWELLHEEARKLVVRKDDKRDLSSKRLDEETHLYIVPFEDLEKLGRWLLDNVL